jgi:hypothetical protein
MKLRTFMSVALVAALAACGTQPSGQAPHVAPAAGAGAGEQAAPLEGVPADGQVYPNGNTFRLMAVEELPITGVTASSTSSAFPPSRMVDGDLSTQWVDGGYRNATSWATVELAASATLGSIDIKTGPNPAGTSYDVQVSSNGTSWTTVRTGLTNTSWNLESKTLPAGTTGKFVRILWKNSASSPQAHFSIFELSVNGENAGSPMPSSTPTITPSVTPSPISTATPPPSGTATKVTPTSITASSTYSGLTPQRAIDGNQSTQWANGGYKDASAWLNLAYASTQAFSSIRVKTGALPAGVSYVVEVSNDGTTWAAASGNLTNTTWNMETKTVSGSGKYLRLRFTNSTSNPIARFSVYEVETFAQAANIAWCEAVAANGPIYEPGASTSGPPSYYLNLDVTKHDDTAFGSFGKFSLSYPSADFYEGLATYIRLEGTQLTVGGTATLVGRTGAHYAGEWWVKSTVTHGPNGTFTGKVASITIGNETTLVDPNSAPTISGTTAECTPDPRTCFSISDDSALLYVNGGGDPLGELLINSLTKTSTGTTGSIQFSGYDGRPSFSAPIQNALFSGDTVTFGGNITGGGTYTFTGIVYRYDVNRPDSYELAPLRFKAFDEAGNPTINFDPGNIDPSFSGGFTMSVGCD